MYYEINVSHEKTGHFFATAPRSILDRDKLKEVHKEIKERFPESDGFSIMVRRWETTGEEIVLGTGD